MPDLLCNILQKVLKHFRSRRWAVPNETRAQPESSTRVVRTCLGDVAADTLGHVQPHEHLLSDFTAILARLGTAESSTASSVGGPDRWASVGGPEIPASVRRKIEEPLTLANYDWVRRAYYNRDNLELTDVAVAITEVELFRDLGGGTIVDLTTIGIGRDARGLARISRATGVHVVVGAGYYAHGFAPRGAEQLSRDQIRDEIVRDIVEGIGETDIRAGIIGEIGLSWPIHPFEERVLRAACEAQQLTGASIQVHPGRHPDSLDAVIEILTDAGADLGRTAISHIDRTVSSAERIIELAECGVYVELDLFGQESSYYIHDPSAVRPNDGTRIEWLMELIAAGHGDQLLISQDICQKVYLSTYGGPGYGHILESAIPLMRSRGMSAEDVDRITRANPARLLALEPGAPG
ncbi:MAG: hypothetical protein QM675_10415 [Protaetiibacter sp.]